MTCRSTQAGISLLSSHKQLQQQQQWQWLGWRQQQQRWWWWKWQPLLNGGSNAAAAAKSKGGLSSGGSSRERRWCSRAVELQTIMSAIFAVWKCNYDVVVLTAAAVETYVRFQDARRGCMLLDFLSSWTGAASGQESWACIEVRCSTGHFYPQYMDPY